ncbi:MAG: cyclic di-GMP phosphodiesterase [Solirubrobacteraceae bacterium]|nr:cyclic di-GMP phosphodiesterase [Solirubrobacteraceae bacterium]
MLQGAWILVAGPDAGTAARLRAALAERGAAAVELALDAEEAETRAVSAQPDAILALPGFGVELGRRLDPLGTGAGPPIVALDELPGLPAGPAGDEVVLDRLALLLERHRLRARVRDLESVLASDAVASHRGALEAQQDALIRLAQAAEYRDDNTWEHTQRVGAIAARLGRAMGLDDAGVHLIRAAAPLHDLGKIAIPDSILLKPDRLTEEEFEVIKTHAALGARILEESKAPLLRTAERICRSHHERWDGTGYPDSLAGDEIPLAGRLVAVADVFDILVHERPYKEGMSVGDAAEELRRNAGTQFDPGVVDAFEELGATTLQTLASEI